MKNKMFNIVVSVILVVVLAVQGFLLVKIHKIDAKLEPDANSLQGGVDLSMVNFDTPYGTFQYPSIWLEQMMIKEERADGVYSIIFSGNLNGKKGELFTITFGGENQEGFVGTINHAGENVPVTIQMATIDKASWTDEEYKTLCDMQKAKDQVQNSIFE